MLTKLVLRRLIFILALLVAGLTLATKARAGDLPVYDAPPDCDRARDVRASPREALASFWAAIRGSASPIEAQRRIADEFGRPPFTFEGCIGGVRRVTVVIMAVRVDQTDAVLMFPRMMVDYVISQPPSLAVRSTMPVILRQGGY